MSHRDLHLDFNLSIDPEKTSGISEEELQAHQESLLQVHRGLLAMHEMGQVQFMHLPYLEDTLREVESNAARLKEEFDTMVVCGIGGSALGAKAILEATRDPLSDHPPRLYVLDTLDPTYIGRLLERLDLRRTVFNVVSKSGNTVETMAQFMLIHERLKKTLGETAFRQHIVMTTDPQKGALREICDKEGLKSFEILKGVGGRFSVLSPVGLLPAAFLGLPLRELAEGAIRMDKRCRIEDLWTNPAAMFALVTFLMSSRHGRNQLVLFNYAENLNGMVEWFRQLWAESLGKAKDLSGKEIRAGITPIQASGPRDQHSQIQLYVEGPANKLVMFWTCEKFDIDPVVPKLYPDLDNLNYLGGKSLSEILHAEVLATQQALKEAGVPSFKLMVEDVDAYTLGQIFYLLEVATVYVGGLLNVNPYDQPGVEAGKKFLYGKLGRSGFKEFEAHLIRRLKDKRYII
jgi:glucose-6-phosphate isomerase